MESIIIIWFSGLLPAKTENDDSWLSNFRSNEWIVEIISSLNAPAYLQAPVNSEGLENAPEISKDAVENTLTVLFDDLHQLSSQFLSVGSSKSTSKTFAI